MSEFSIIDIWAGEKNVDDPITSADFNLNNDNLKKIYENTEYLKGCIENAAASSSELVYNGRFTQDFGLWSNGDNVHPDGWILEDPEAGAVILKDNDGSVKITVNQLNSNVVFRQDIHEFPGWRQTLQGNMITAYFDVQSNEEISLKIYDGINLATKTVSSGKHTLTMQISEDAACVRLIVEIIALNTIVHVHEVGAGIGDVYTRGLLCIIQGVIGEIKTYDATETAPAGEFELNGIELPANYSRLDSFINGKFGRGVNNRSLLNDMRGMFERAWAHGSVNDADRDIRLDRGDGVIGDHVGTIQLDAIRNITGGGNNPNNTSGKADLFAIMDTPPDGAFGYEVYGMGSDFAYQSNNAGYFGLNFDASRVVPVGSDNRPANKYTLKTIRWC